MTKRLSAKDSDKNPDVFDYIVVGAGSAGCVLADRLSEDPGVRVMVIEAGGRDWNPFIRMPAGLAKLVHNVRINWGYHTEPEPNLQNRRLFWPRGRVVGGSSAINAMCYTRGQPADYDHWAALGCSGWAYRDVLPYFKKAQHQERGASEFHGVGGKLNVQDLRYRNPLSETFVAAAEALGYARNDDFNGACQEGVGFYQVTQKRGVRCSAASAYLKPAWSRPNLIVTLHALAHRVLFENGRAVALEYSRRGRLQRVRARREILLCGGAVNSPQLLLLSGVGPADHLRALDIPVIHDLPGVGENLQDHLDICTLYRSTQPISYNLNPWQEALVALRYFTTHTGIGTSNAAEAGGFARSVLARDTRPDIQFHFVPALLDDHARNRLPGHGYTLHACGLRPISRGRIRLKTAHPADYPAIYANYLAAEEDMTILLEAVNMARAILAAKPFDPYRGAEIFPGAQIRSETELREFIRRKAETIYHPVGTCKMGEDAMAVLASDLTVRGLQGLRVVDASVMPTLISGNTNAPTIMIAEKAADLIKRTSYV